MSFGSRICLSKTHSFTQLSWGTHALIWAQQLSGLFRVLVIMTPGFASTALRKLSMWGQGGWQGQGSPRSESTKKGGAEE